MVDPHKFDDETTQETDTDTTEERDLSVESSTQHNTMSTSSEEASSSLQDEEPSTSSQNAFFSAANEDPGMAGPREASASIPSDQSGGTGSQYGTYNNEADTPDTHPELFPNTRRLMNPYMAGVLLGLVLLLSYLTLGAGLGASGGIARIAATLEEVMMPGHVGTTSYFGAWGENPWMYYLVFMFAGTFIGGLLSAVAGRRVRLTIERGRRCSASTRLIFALFGGILAGYASRVAHGCTSGQALSGGALLLTGSVVFMGSLFLTGYIFAWFVRRQWND